MVFLCVLFLIIFLHFHSNLGGFFEDGLDQALGMKYGIQIGSSIPSETLQKVINGAKKRDPNSLYFFGLLKLYGISMSVNTTIASSSFKLAAELGHPEAMTAFAMCLLNGIGQHSEHTVVESLGFLPDRNLVEFGINNPNADPVSAISWLRKAVKAEDPNAHWLLAKLLIEGTGTSFSPLEARSLLLKVSGPPHHLPQAKHYLGVMCEYGIGIEGEIEGGIEDETEGEGGLNENEEVIIEIEGSREREWRGQIKDGREGRGREGRRGSPDFLCALKYYEEAAQLNYPDSIYHLALMLSQGRGQAVDHRRALSLFEVGARLRHPPSCYFMGVYKLYGFGCEPNYQQAVSWFELAAGQDDYRVSSQAHEAAEEVKRLMKYAEEENQRVVDRLIERGNTY